MSFRKIPLGRYITVKRNPNITLEEVYNILYKSDIDDCIRKDWVELCMRAIQTEDIYLIHTPLEGCYIKKFVSTFDSVAEMEEEWEVKPLYLKQLGEL